MDHLYLSVRLYAVLAHSEQRTRYRMFNVCFPDICRIVRFKNICHFVRFTNICHIVRFKNICRFDKFIKFFFCHKQRSFTLIHSFPHFARPSNQRGQASAHDMMTWTDKYIDDF